jgi:aspartate ammonia-lyase
MSRIERDPLGEFSVPDDAYYGIQTARAVENFPISGLRAHPDLVTATILIKKAAALANMALGRLDARIGNAIVAAADEVLGGALRDQFVVDVYQAGAGTSHNMNSNEVLANRAAERLGGTRGEYAAVHPNDHVNMGQSDERRVSDGDATVAAARARRARRIRARPCSLIGPEGDPVRVGPQGRPHPSPGRGADDARPGVRRLRRLHRSRGGRRRAGVRAVEGIEPGRDRRGHRPECRRRLHGAGRRLPPALHRHRSAPGGESLPRHQSMGDVLAYSGAMRRLAVELGKIASDLRLLSMGPRAGLGEIVLPAVQPGSSIMPGKVNPSVPEMVNMVSFQVIGCDTTVCMAAEAGQLELNVMMPVIAWNALHSSTILRRR